MMKKLMFLLVFSLLLVACRPSVTGNVVNNLDVLAEIRHLGDITIERDLTKEDFAKLRGLTNGDKVADHAFEEIDWLLANGEAEHAEHSLAYLNTYAQTGKAIQCVAHEMTHIRLYLKHQDYEMVDHALDELQPAIGPWIERSESLKAKFPAYYQNFDEVKTTVFDTVDRLKASDFTENTIKKLEFLEKNAVC